MTTPIDGYRKNMRATVPALVAECEARVTAAARELELQQEALAFIRGIAAAGMVGLETKPAPSADSDAGGSLAVDLSEPHRTRKTNEALGERNQ